MADQSGASVDWIAPEDAAALLEAGDAVIVDVREPAEIAATGKAAGALEIPLGAIAARAHPAAPDRHPALTADKTVILYCGSGKRSENAGLKLKQLGFEKVLNLGGFKDWAAAGLPVEKASK
jgi:rhodanese-related sulfurtransferase